jgi:outer membrane protein assembly factor BamB/serine/threonine protein kinase
MIDNNPPQRLGNYRVLHLIGEGGLARAYLGEHIYLKTYSALKVPKLMLAQEDIEFFLNEARTGINLRHPNIVRTLECGVEGGTTPYLVMDYAPGGSVNRRYQKGTPLPPAVIISYVKQAGSALQYIHDLGLIHQDVKPANMLLGTQGELLLSDFGLAAIVHHTVTQMTQDMMGTARYMAPEQFLGKPRPASDQYALAVITYEWICGDRPFEGSLMGLYQQHTYEPPPPLHTKVANIAPQVEEVIMKALSKDPRERFSRIQDFVNALEYAGQASQVSHPTSSPLLDLTGLTEAVSEDDATMRKASNSLPAMPVQSVSPAPTPSQPGRASQSTLPSLSPSTPIPPAPTQPARQGGYEYSPPRQLYPQYQQAEDNEEFVPTILSHPGLPAMGRPVAPAPIPVTPPPPVVAPKNERWRPSRKVVMLLAGLAVLIVAGSVSFFTLPLFHAHTTPPATPGNTTPKATVPGTSSPPPPYTPTFGFNTQHTRYNPNESTLSTSTVGHLRLGWKEFTSSPIRSSPLVSNGMVYISSTDNNVYAFNVSTGAKVWQMPTGSYREPGSFIFSSPTILNGVLYIGSNDHHVYAFDAVTGKQLWMSAATGGPIYSSPAVVNGVLYIGSTDDSVYAYNISNGSLRWKVATKGPIYSSPAVVNNIVYIGSDDFKLYALDAATGHILWTGAASSNFNTSPSVVDGVVYIGSDDHSVYAFQATCSQASCPPLWVVPTGNYIRSSTAIANGILYVGSHDKTLYAFDTRQCANVECPPLWKATLGNDIESSPTVANGVVYVGSLDGKIYALNARTGTILWSFLTGGPIISSPTVLNGVLYVGSTDQNLYAFHL